MNSIDRRLARLKAMLERSRQEKVPRAPVKHAAMPAPTPQADVVWHSTFGTETIAKAHARLERTRKLQERAWFWAGYSREEIVSMFEGWPTQFGYPPYDWTVGGKTVA